MQIAVEDRGPGIAPRPSAISSSSASPAVAAPDGARAARAPGSDSRWSTSTCACTAGRVWVEDRLDGESGARFVIELMATELDE